MDISFEGIKEGLVTCKDKVVEGAYWMGRNIKWLAQETWNRTLPLAEKSWNFAKESTPAVMNFMHAWVFTGIGTGIAMMLGAYQIHKKCPSTKATVITGLMFATGAVLAYNGRWDHISNIVNHVANNGI